MNRRALLQALMAIPMGLMGARAKQDTPMVAGFRVGVGKIAIKYGDSIECRELCLEPGTVVYLPKEWRMSQMTGRQE